LSKQRPRAPLVNKECFGMKSLPIARDDKGAKKIIKDVKSQREF
jgi:hypothetical protein